MPLDDNDGENGSGSDSDDPDQSRSVPKIFSQRQDDYAPDPDSVVEGNPLKNSISRKGFQVPLISSDTLSLASICSFTLLYYLVILCIVINICVARRNTADIVMSSIISGTMPIRARCQLFVPCFAVSV